jgi:2-(3-amino-3-carboxypropyl)histidine synthase
MSAQEELLSILCKNYALDLGTICAQLKAKKYQRVGIQLPDGLRLYAIAIANYIERDAQVDVLLSGDTCYGACDLATESMAKLGADCILHFGHTPLHEDTNTHSVVPTMFIELPAQMDVCTVVRKAVSSLPRCVGIVTTCQHVHMLAEVKRILERAGFSPIIGKGDSRIKYDGQVLGCNFSSARAISTAVDGYLFIGTGNFHPLGVALATGKPVIIADPYLNEVRTVAELRAQIIRERYGVITTAQNAEAFGIIISTKRWQFRAQLALRLREQLRTAGKTAHLLVMDNIEPERVDSFRGFDALVSTACPRIAIDDRSRYRIPILTPPEVEILLGTRAIGAYKFDEI